MVHGYGLDGLPRVEQLYAVFPCGLVGPPQGLGLPIRPVDEVLKQGQAHHALDVVMGHWGDEREPKTHMSAV